jgi:hypothetical protein
MFRHRRRPNIDSVFQLPSFSHERRVLGAGEIVPFEADALAWLDAFSLVEDGLTNGAPVPAWTSRFNSATASASQSGSSAIPSFSTDVDGTGKPGVVFDGIGNYLTLGNAWKLAYTTSWTQYIVVRRSSNATKAITGWSVGTGGSYLYQFVSSVGNVAHNYSVASTFSLNITSPSFTTGARKIMTVTSPAGGGYSVHTNADQAFTTGSKGTTISATQPLMGARWATGGLVPEFFLQGTIQCSLAYGVAHDTAQRTAVLAFLADRYGVTL